MKRYLFIFAALMYSIGTYAQHDGITPTGEFKVTGSVKREMSFTINDILHMKQDSLGDVVVRNHQGQPKDYAKQMWGVLLKNVLDSAGVVAEKHKDYSELLITLIASDGYKNVYSWNELFNTEVGNHVYIITSIEGKKIVDMKDRILVMSLSDISSGRRHLKALSKIEVSKVK